MSMWLLLLLLLLLFLFKCSCSVRSLFNLFSNSSLSSFSSSRTYRRVLVFVLVFVPLPVVEVGKLDCCCNNLFDNGDVDDGVDDGWKP